MGYLFLVIAVICLAIQNVALKQYSKREAQGNFFLYTTLTSSFALLFFVVSSGFKLTFDMAYIPYSVGFALAYGGSMFAYAQAIKSGSLSLSALISAYSLIIPSVYGVAFLKEKLSAVSYVGIVLLLISLFLINMNGKEEKRFSLKWVVCIVIHFIGNGMCSTLQKMQQTALDGNFKNEFMIAALLLVAVTFALTWIFTTKRGERLSSVKACAPYSAVHGLSNGATNLLVLFLTGLLPTAIFFPSMSAGGIITTFFVALFIYKEKLSKAQIVGFAIGVLSVVLLNL